jgi:hypothetical protein
VTVDPDLALTGQPYAYTGDDPVNAVDPNGLDCGEFSFACAAYDATAGEVKSAGVTVKVLGAYAGLQITNGIGAATNWADEHITLSGVVCFESCFGVELQNGEFYKRSGGSHLVGLSGGIGYSSSTPTQNCGPSNEYGFGSFSGSKGPDGAYSFGWGPGYLFGKGKIYTSSPWP